MSTDKRRSGYNRPLTESERKQAMKVGAILATGAMIFLVVLAFLVHVETVKLHPNSVTERSLETLVARFEYAFKYQSMLVFWLVFSIISTIVGRLGTRALNPLDEKTEVQVQFLKNSLTNSLEQIIVSILSQLIFVSFASPAAVLKVIPYVNVVQIIGRITFFAGYPMKRSFGFLSTMTPNVLLSFYNMYKFFSFLGLY